MISRKTISRSLVGLGLLGMLSGGCASTQANRTETESMPDRSRAQTYTFDYDEVPFELAVALYGFEHGETPTTADQLTPYNKVARDINGNNVLDFRRQMTFVPNENYFIEEMFERVITRAEASSSGQEEVLEAYLNRQPNGDLTHLTYEVNGVKEETDVDAEREAERFQELFTKYRDGKLRRNIEHTNRTFDQLIESFNQNRGRLTIPLQ